MNGEAVLIAAFSGRSLAQSARRAGYRPLVVDAFGDLDTQDAAEDFRVLDGAMQTGFRTKPLIAALEDLARSSATKPLGLVLGSGFEDKPRLVAALGSRFKLLGSDAATYKACKDPRSFFPLLDKLGVPHPETQTDPPTDSLGWISKRTGGSGGRHIRVCQGPQRAKPRRYFQKLLDGERISASLVVSPTGTNIFQSRQWTSPTPTMPFRYGGAVSLPSEDTPAQFGVLKASTELAESLGLKGLVSVDCLVVDEKVYVLEVNPRPGATLDIFDDKSGSLFKDHVFVCKGGKIEDFEDEDISSADWSQSAAAILHADRGSITLGEIPWPDWSADRGPPGTFIPAGAPLATVFAEAPTADAAEALARKRLAELEDLIYGHAKS
ncbi:ATP-grasp domain-containing protein [Hyphomicrobium sp.]|uniref:ATP-grasp domain-containing protein n=1 Tax=Hyphomicrobium sp. TaxID=82 RepID=UPI000FBBB8D5|nr:ATP-grasp domain-containing protein [Hyphomicrobium sp.]RUP10601.1 MAG: ATP-grasp domain-containing protein [Hyphomicrobium sp.]